MDSRRNPIECATRVLFTVAILASTGTLLAQNLSSQKFQKNKPDIQVKTIARNNFFAGKKDVFGFGGSFIENVGQYSLDRKEYSYMGDIQFGFQGFNMPVFFTRQGLIFWERKPKPKTETEKDSFDKEETENDAPPEKVPTTVMTMQWVNSSPNTQIIAEDECEGDFSFGLVTKKARGFKKLTYKNLYPGIDVSYFFNNNGKPGFEYSISVSPGADITKLKMLVEGDLAHISPIYNGGVRLKTSLGGFVQSIPVAYYKDKLTRSVPVSFATEKNTIGFNVSAAYDKTKTLVIDPFISPVSTLTGANAGKAKDIDFDYAGNIYVSGGGDGTTPQMLAKYDAGGTLQWTFSGVLANPSWQFNTYYGGWVVDKSNGNVYIGQGFQSAVGFRVIRLNTAGLYDNYITTANPNFREDWKMYWMCNNGSPQILVAGGGTNSNINFGLMAPPSTTISSLNITGIPYSPGNGWAQDISDMVIDPVTSEMYTIYGSLYGTPSLSNQIYKTASPYSAASLLWNTYSGFKAIQEVGNRPYMKGTLNDNSSNVLAVNSSYFFYWDGKNLKAFNKATGATVGTPLTINANVNLMSGGIIADECNNIYVGSTNGTIKVYKFNGSTFDYAADPDITIPGYSANSVYDLAYNDADKLLYASGDGFVASFDVSSYGCVTTPYTINIAASCGTGSATVTISPAPPVGSSVTYVLYNGNTQIGSNTTGVFTGLKPAITYTIKVYVNQVCSGSTALKQFVLPGPALSLLKTDATCGNVDGTITATASGSAGPYTYSKDGVSWQGSGLFSGLAAGLYVITAQDAGGCKTTDSIIIKNTNGPVLTFSKTDALCSINTGTITASAKGGQAPLQYSINGTTFQTGNIFVNLPAGNYVLSVKDAAGCTNSVAVNIAALNGPLLAATPATTTCNSNNGSITVFGSGGAAPLLFSINGNSFQAGNVFNGLSAGTYPVTVKDNNGCIQTISIAVPAAPVPLVTAVSTPAVCNNINGTITATVTGGAAPLQYSINGTAFQASSIFTGLAAGNYTVTVTDGNVCNATSMVTVGNSNGPVASATATSSSCNTNNGTVTVTATGTAPFQYSINGVVYQSGNVFAGLAAGNYTMYVKDASGCISTVSLAVTSLAGPQITGTTTPTACGVNNGIIQATGTGGSAPLLYSINGVTFQAGNTFTGLGVGTYTVTVKDASGCTQSITENVQNTSGLSLTASAINATCTNNNGLIMAVVTGGVLPITHSIDGVNFQAGNLFTGLAGGTYTVTVKDANNCKVTATVTVGSVSGPTISTVKTDANCNGDNGAITAGATGGTQPYQFSINGINYQTSGSFINLAPGTFTVTVKDSAGCTSTNTVTIVNKGTGTPPQIIVNAADPASCGVSDGAIEVSGNNGTAPYQFTIDGVNFNTTGRFTGLAPGIYTATIKDANGCTATVQITIGSQSTITLTTTVTQPTCGVANGVIVAVAGNGDAPYQYTLNGVTLSGTGVFTGLAPGSYTITVTDGSSCTATVTVTLVNTGGAAFTPAATNSTCAGNNGSVTVNKTTGSSPFQYSLNGGPYQTTNVFAGLFAGFYTVAVNDATGCISNDTITVNNTSGPLLTIARQDATCNLNNGGVTAAASGGTVPYRFSIDGTTFQRGGYFGNLAPGNYTVTVADTGGCFTTAQVTIAAKPLPAVTAYTVNASCAGSDGQIIASGIGGTLPYIFSINGTVFQSSNIFTGLKAGAYNVVIKDATGCDNTAGVTVTNNAGILLALGAGPATCGNNNGAITATASGGVSPLLYSIDGINFQAGNIFSPLAPGQYNISVKDAHGCLEVKTALVTNTNGPQQLAETVTNALCGNSNGSIALTASGGTPPLQYSINGTAFQPGNIFTGLAANSYTFTVKDANGCTKTGNATVLDLAGPVVSSKVLPTLCNNPNGIIFINAAGGTVPLQYSIDGVNFQGSATFSGLAAGNYTITVKDANGCTSSTPATVGNTNGATITTAGTSAACGKSNGSITASPTGGTAPLQYSIDGVSFQGSATFNGLAAGNYTITVKDANGCTNTASATIGNTNGATITAAATSAACGKSNGSITASPTGGMVPLQYSIDGMNFQSSATFSGLAAGNYTITVKDASGCTNTASATVGNTNGATITASTNSAACGKSNGSITATPTGGTSPLQYSIDGMNFQSSATFSGLAAGNYTITVKDANGCTNTASATVGNTNGATITASTNSAACGKSNGSITATPTGGTSPLQYSIDGMNFQSSATFSGLAAGNYTITVKDANGCTNTASAKVGNTNGATITAAATSAACGKSNGSVTATPTGGTLPLLYSIDGVNFQSSATFNGLAAGNYTITVKDANGCTNNASATVGNTNGATITASANSAACGKSNGSITATPTGGTAPLQYSIDGVNFQTSATFTGLSAGNYTITVKDANGCTNTASATVGNTNGATITAAATSAACGKSNGSITATPTGGTAPLQYSIDGMNFQTSATFTGLSAGNYTITVKDANGCTNTASATVGNTNGATITAAATSAACGKSNGSITATPTGGTAPLQYSIDGVNFQNGATFTGLAAGNYTITVKDANGCMSTTAITVNASNSITAVAGADQTICQGVTTQLMATSDGTSFLWTPTTGLSGTTVLKPYAMPLVTTTYILTATSGTCIHTDSVKIYVNPLPVAHTGPDTAICHGKSVQLNGSGGLKYQWLPVTYLSNPYIQNPVVRHPGNSITYILTVIDSNNCTSAMPDSVKITVIPPQVVSAGRDTVIAVNQPLQLNAVDVSNAGFISYAWSPMLGLNNPRIKSPVAIVNKDIIYTVTVVTGQGCQASSSVTVRVYEGPDIYIPSAFTPNGDGKNDIFRPIPVGIRQYKSFSVYNRFGELIYTTDTPLEGWDGTYKGKLQPPGTYVWQVTAVAYNGAMIYKKGTVVLVR